MMKNKLKILSLIIAMLFIFVACGGNDNNINNNDSAKKGSLVIAVPMTTEEKSVLQAVADAYRIHNPLVSVTIDAKGGEGYKDYLSSILSASNLENVSLDIVRNNLVTHFYGSNKFVDFTQYLSEPNPYANDNMWRDTLDSIAYIPDGANGEIFALNFQSTQVSFYYNKTLFNQAGINADNISSWTDFVNACELIEENTDVTNAIVASGNEDSFWSGQMSWIFRTYVDQYFRDVAEDVHTQNGDWNYDRIKDGNWEFQALLSDFEDENLTEVEKMEIAYYNDDPRIYTMNELRLLDKITNEELGHNTSRYKNMLANLKMVFPTYCTDGFSSSTPDETAFWTGKAAITVDTTDLLIEWKKRYDLDPDNMFEIGRFDFPAMTTNSSYPDGAPYADYTRSIGGPHGYYGIINKSASQTALAMDFMMYWASKEGQDVEMQKRKELNLLIKGVPYVKNVNIPEEINILGDTKLKGIADFNPACIFARGLGNEGNTTRDFQNYTQQLFAKTNAIPIDTFSNYMQASLNSHMEDYLNNRGYRSDCLNDVRLYPF